MEIAALKTTVASGEGRGTRKGWIAAQKMLAKTGLRDAMPPQAVDLVLLLIPFEGAIE